MGGHWPPEMDEDTKPKTDSHRRRDEDKELAKNVGEIFAPGISAVFKWFKKEGKGVRDGFWGMLIIAGVAGWIGYKYGLPDPEERRDLETQIDSLKRDNQLDLK